MAINISDAQMSTLISSAMENPTLNDTDNDDVISSSYSMPSFPELNQCSEEQQSLLTQSQYALVVFHGIADTYPTDSDILCRYSLTDGVEAAPGDRVVLFTVGWSSIKDYIVFEWAPIPEKGEKDLAVVFKATDLPKDANEFYQVCYVSKEGAVCGASVPFQVRTPHDDELNFSLEEDMVIVRSSTAIAHEKLLKAQLERENLKKKKVNIEKELQSEEKQSLILGRLDRLQEPLSISNTLNEELKEENTHLLDIEKQMLCIKKQSKEARSKLHHVERDKRKIQEDIKDLISVALEYCTEYSKTEEYLKINDSEIDDEDVTLRLSAAIELFRKLGEERQICQKKLESTQYKIQQIKHSKALSDHKNFVLDNELTVCKFNLNNAHVENLRLKAELDDFVKCNKKLKEQIRNSKQVEESYPNSYTHFSTNEIDKGKLIMENQKLQKTTEDLQLTISALEHQKFTLTQILEETLNSQKVSCSDHCNLEKCIAQLQFHLKTTCAKEDVEKKQSYSDTDQASSLKAQVDTLTQLLDDVMKDNELHIQENMTLRIQNEFLESRLSRDNSKLQEYVIVSTHNDASMMPQTSTSRNQPHETEIVNLKAENKKLLQELTAYANRLADKDVEVHDLHSQIEAMKNEYFEIKKELQLEITNLISRNSLLIEQERTSQELKNEMRKITFMNEELLAQNASLMEKVHNSREELTKDKRNNCLQKTSNLQNVDLSLAIENKHLRKQLESAYEELNQTWKQAGTALSFNKLEYHTDLHDSFQNESLVVAEKINSATDVRHSQYSEQCDMPSQRLTCLDTKVDNECHHKCCVEPKLEQISQSVGNVLSVVENLASYNKIKRNEQCTLDKQDLKDRLMLAKEEYLKLYAIMVNYKTKYNHLKAKYKAKKSEQRIDV